MEQGFGLMVLGVDQHHCSCKRGKNGEVNIIDCDVVGDKLWLDVTVEGPLFHRTIKCVS